VAAVSSLKQLGPRPALFARAIGAVVMAMGAAVVMRAW